jgi:RNA polymerase sigma-70 factor (ECF subfamily)
LRINLVKSAISAADQKLDHQMENYQSISIEELVRRCSVSGETGAWEEFVRRFHRLIATVVLRTARALGNSSIEIVDDLIQETYLKLCADDFRILKNFEETHPDAFLGYVKVIAANVVRDSFKSVSAKKRGQNQVQQFGEPLDAIALDDEGEGPKFIERALLIQEIDRHLDFCVAGQERERNRRVFWLHYRAGLSAGAIASLPGIDLTTKGVESILFRITRELRERVATAKTNSLQNQPKPDEGILPAKSF